MGHVVGMFFDWPDCFYSGGLEANWNVSEKRGMKLAIRRHLLHWRRKLIIL